MDLTAKPVPPAPAAGTEDAPGARLSVELQLTYATGVVAGTLMGAYQIVQYGRTTGFSSIWDMYAASGVAMILELVTAGMILHIMYRGFWISGRLLAETRADQGMASAELLESWERDIRRLDGTCQAFFFGTFKFLYIGMFIGVVSVGIHLVQQHGVWWTQFIGWLIVGFSATTGLLGILRKLAGTGRLGRAVESALFRLKGFRSSIGLWWLQNDPGSSSLMRRAGFFWLATVVSGMNFWLMTQPELQADKPVYSRSGGDRIVLDFRCGGVVPGPDAKVTLSVDATGLASGAASPRFHQLDLGHFVSVVAAKDFSPGVVGMKVVMTIDYHSEKGHASIRPDAGQTRFLVAP